MGGKTKHRGLIFLPFDEEYVVLFLSVGFQRVSIATGNVCICLGDDLSKWQLQTRQGSWKPK